LISLYLRGVLRTDEKGFRALYRDSAVRMLNGLGTPEHGAGQANGNGRGDVGSPGSEVSYTRYRTGT
jgi:hypothetical protein